jgi:hypothetical protein
VCGERVGGFRGFQSMGCITFSITPCMVDCLAYGLLLMLHSICVGFGRLSLGYDVWLGIFGRYFSQERQLLNCTGPRQIHEIPLGNM